LIEQSKDPRRALSKSEQMARVRSRDTRPEKLVRSILSNLGVRYRLHRKELPGRPDIYISRLRLAVFVNGCFWHNHDCARGRKPKTNVKFWHKKIRRNRARDRKALEGLRSIGVTAVTLWTCEYPKFEPLCRRIARHYMRALR